MNSFIQILRFASTLESLSYQRLYDYINKNNITFFEGEKITESNSILINFFKDNFQDEHGNRPIKHTVGIYYLRSSALIYLLSYDALEQAKLDANTARKESVESAKLAKWAIYIAVASLTVTAFLATIQIILQWRSI